MLALYFVCVTIHVLAALVWLGGLFFLGLVGAPVLRKVEPASLRQQLFAQLGLRFRTIGWGAIVVLVATGIGNLHFRGWLSWEAVWSRPEFWRSATGQALAVKLAAVIVMVAISWLHDFVLGPAATRVPADALDAPELRRRAARLARVNALLGVVVVIAAVRLVRGG